MSVTVVSFFTPNWEYPQHAERLAEECEALNLPSLIYPLPDRGDYLSNTRHKPGAIMSGLLDTRGPVLWLDVDSSILRQPEELDLGLDFMAVKNTHKPDRRWHVATMFFNYTSSSLLLLGLWLQALGGWSDDEAFGRLWRDLDEGAPPWSGKTGELPKTYLDIESTASSWTPSPGAVIVARLSSSPAKNAFLASGKSRP